MIPGGCDGPADHDVFVGPLSAYDGALSWGGACHTVSAAAVADPAFFDTLIDRFQAAHASRDRQATISLWSQTYFRTLTVAAVARTIGQGYDLSLDFDATRISFCPGTGRPLSFHMLGTPVRRIADPRFESLIERHLAPLIAVLRLHSGLSGRVLWENAGWPMIWALGEMKRLDPRCGATIGRILKDPSWPSGQINPLEGMKRAAFLDLPIRRRVCCLRDRIPGFGRCQGLCPFGS